MNRNTLDSPIRVLHIIGRMDRAGAETMVMNLYREIDRNKFQFDFVYFSADHCDYDDEIESLGGHIYRISATNPLARFLTLYRLLKRGVWKIVHSHTLFSSGLHLTAARLAGVPCRIAHSHNTQDVNSSNLLGRIYQRLARKLLFWTRTHCIACGIAAAEYLFPGQKDVTLIPNAVDIDLFADASGTALRKDLDIFESQLVILQVGRFMPVKNHVRSLAIARALKQMGTDFQLLLVGAGPEQNRIDAVIRDQGLEGYVHLLGSRDDIPKLMAAANVMLMPSLHEGFPVVLVEAQAAGLQSVVSKAVSREVELGMGMVRFVELDDSDKEWADALLAAAMEEKPDAQSRRAALEKAGFSSKSCARRLQEVYTQI